MRLTLLATVVALQPQRAALRGAPALALAQHHVEHAVSHSGKLPEQPPLALTATAFTAGFAAPGPPQAIVTTCSLLLFTIMGSVLAACCCTLSPSATTAVRVVGGVASLAALVYVFAAGIWTRWQLGGELGTSCGLLLFFVIVNIVEIALACCCGAIYVTAVVVEKLAHPTVEKMQRRVTEAQPEPPEKFKERCAELFRRADTDGDGFVDAEEMRHAAGVFLPKEVEAVVRKDPLFLDMFDANGDQKLSPEEFETFVLYCMTFKQPASPKPRDAGEWDVHTGTRSVKPEAPKAKPEPPKPEPPKPKQEQPKKAPKPASPRPAPPQPAAPTPAAPTPAAPKPAAPEAESERPITPRDNRDNRRRRQQEDMRRREEERKRLGSG